MPSRKRDYDEFSAQEADRIQQIIQRQEKRDESVLRFAAQWMINGYLGYYDPGNKSYHFPSARTLVRLYIIAYEHREARLMNDVMKYIQKLELSLKPMARTIWEWTARMCAELGRPCTLRNIILDEVLLAVHEGRMSREEIAVEAKYSFEFQKEFFPRLGLLGMGLHKFGFDQTDGEGYSFEFPAVKQSSDNKKNQEAKPLMVARQLHPRVLALLRLKGRSDSEDEPLNANDDTSAIEDDKVSAENIPSLRSSELRSLEKYIEVFPDGCELIATSADQLLCGLDSLSKSIAEMHPDLPCPRVRDLQEIVTSEEYQKAAKEFTWEENQSVNTNLFTADQLARILQLWGERSGTVFQLGWLTEKGIPHLVPCSNENIACVVWIYNDDAEEEFSEIGAVGTELGNVLGHWSGLRPKSSSLSP